jgi:hypothetical protein
MYNSCVTLVKVGDGSKVRLTEETNYPFEESIKFTFNMERKVPFPFYLRVPGWSKKASLTINNQSVKVTTVGGSYIRIDREWNNNDQVKLTLPMEISIRTWQANQNSVSVDYGPLTFSLKIKEEYKKLNSTKTAIADSKWQEGADPEKWPAFEIAYKTPWNYGLVIINSNATQSFKLVRKVWPKDNYPFSPENVPIELKAKGRRIPSWKIDKNGLVDVLPLYPAITDQPIENIDLIPMGAARLRISAFPTVK